MPALDKREATPLVCVFAKLPQAGQVKTRLIPLLGAERAARFHQRCVSHTLATVHDNPGWAVELWCAPDPEHAFFDDCHHQFGFNVAAQGDGDLGARMHRALLSGLARHHKVILIGTDCPALSAENIEQAVAALDEVDVVATPAEDGGYVLIGARDAPPELFADVAWSTADVLAETRANVGRLGLTWRELACLWDIDRPEDYERLRAEPQSAHLCV